MVDDSCLTLFDVRAEYYYFQYKIKAYGHPNVKREWSDPGRSIYGDGF